VRLEECVRPLQRNLLGKIHLKDPGDWLAGSLGSRMRVCDVDGWNWLSLPKGRLWPWFCSSSVSATIVHSILTTVAHVVRLALKYVFVYTSTMQSCRVQQFRSSPLLLLNISLVLTDLRGY